MSAESCPLCGADFAYGPSGEYSRRIGAVIPWIYDGILFWQCPDCAGRWHRFAPDHRLHKRAVPYVNRTITNETGI